MFTVSISNRLLQNEKECKTMTQLKVRADEEHLAK